MKNYISLILIFSHIVFARSGDRAGNGGDAIVCYEEGIKIENIKNSTPKSTLVKDYWEYSQMINDVPLALGPGKTYREKVLFVLERLKKIDSYRAEILIERFSGERFFSLVRRGQIPVVDDSNSYLKPSKDENCFEVQVAFQILHPRMFQSKVLIDKEIFNNMNEEHKAGLLLHELLYEQDIKYAKATDSDTIRWFNYILSSDINVLFDDQKDGFSQKYFQMISENKVDYFDYGSQQSGSALYNSQSASHKKYHSEILPENFSITKSHFVMDGEKTVKANIEMLVEDKEMTLSGSQVTFLNDKLSYELKNNKESLEGFFNISMSNMNFEAYKIVSSNEEKEFHSVTGTKLNIKENSFDSVSKITEDLEKVKLEFKGGLSLSGLEFQCLGKCRAEFFEEQSFKLYGDFNIEGRQISFNGNSSAISLEKPILIRFENAGRSARGRVQRLKIEDGKLFAHLMTPRMKRAKLKLTIDISKSSFELNLTKRKEYHLKIELGEAFRIENVTIEAD